VLKPPTLEPPTRVAWIGPSSDPEMAAAWRWLQQRAEVQSLESFAELLRFVQAEAVDVVLFSLPTRPLPDSRQLLRLQRESPLTRIVFLLGTWLMAAGRTAAVPSGVQVCRWDRWESWAARHLAAPRPEDWVGTAERVDHLLSLRQQPEFAASNESAGLKGPVVILAGSRTQFESLASALGPLSPHSVWARTETPLVAVGCRLLVIDGSPDDLPLAMAWKSQNMPDTPCLIVSGWQPNIDPVLHGQFQWLRKPYYLADLWAAALAASVKLPTPIGVQS
jgi:hypothetical protein